MASLLAGSAVTVGLLVAWMSPNTVPVTQQSVLAQLSARAAAERPSVSPVPDSAIPSGIATLPPPPAIATATPRAAPMPVLAPSAPASTEPPPAAEIASDDRETAAGAPPPILTPPPPSPPPADQDYASARAQWQAQMSSFARQAPQRDGG